MPYAIVFTLLAATLLLNAWQVETWWWTGLLAWTGIAFALVAMAYAGNAAWVFGKRADGTMQVIPTLVLLPYRLLATSLWWLNTRLSDEAPWHRIDDRLVVGRRLTDRDGLPPGITRVLDLTCEFPEPRIMRGTGYQCLPMLDASHTDSVSIIRIIREILSEPGVLYVHCAQGHGRTGLVAALILIAQTPGLSPADALARLQAIRPGIGLSRRQSQALNRIAMELART